MDNLGRRDFLQLSLGGFLGYGLARAASISEFVSAQEAAVPKRAKRLIVLWMDGGPSQIETWDPKPGKDTGGPFKAIDTSVRGIQIGECLPQLAGRMGDLSIVRSLSSPEGEHLRGTYFLHTGHSPKEGFSYPSMGSIVSLEKSENVDIPRYVTIGGRGFGPAFLGDEHAPFLIDDPLKAKETMEQVARQKERMNLIADVDAGFAKGRESEMLLRREKSLDRVRKLAESRFARALDLSQEPEQLKDQYGRRYSAHTPFGLGCLMARRLLEIGVRCVEVSLGVWDTHTDNFNQSKALCEVLDPAFSTLIQDLKAKGLFEETLILWMGEFGRTPRINAAQGRDHYPNVNSVVLAGGPILGGRVIGETDELGIGITKDPVTPADLFATVYHALGINPSKKYKNLQGGIVKATEDGKFIPSLF